MPKCSYLHTDDRGEALIIPASFNSRSFGKEAALVFLVACHENWDEIFEIRDLCPIRFVSDKTSFVGRNYEIVIPNFSSLLMEIAVRLDILRVVWAPIPSLPFSRSDGKPWVSPSFPESAQVFSLHDKLEPSERRVFQKLHLKLFQTLDREEFGAYLVEMAQVQVSDRMFNLWKATFQAWSETRSASAS